MHGDKDAILTNVKNYDRLLVIGICQRFNQVRRGCNQIIMTGTYFSDELKSRSTSASPEADDAQNNLPQAKCYSPSLPHNFDCLNNQYPNQNPLERPETSIDCTISEGSGTGTHLDLPFEALLPAPKLLLVKKD
jgi:hypothetical protein